ncbi:hypothetical protein [Hymenobacter rubripertinctus]|uniref:Uncharacterized protein n=1 Tax=Hymenobacter rubripertinctus TaxID=2029981 RepID=A0A418R8Z6_9BACT|nr:hypothetical protein [Hymenobacter rubripertinctus]RIY13764.1 hypothetical protein D0T11_01400 [Hymenobacter rubripertinctus]
MFTPQQFSQLAAAAWSGPAAIVQASASSCLLAQSHLAVYYSVTYTAAGVMFMSPVCGTCPFEAVAAAIAAAAAAGVPVCRYKAQRTLARTAAALCGVAAAPSFACRARRHRVARRLAHV